MLLVNVGQHTINIEQVVAFHQNEDHVKVMFNTRSGDAPSSDSSLYTIELTGEEAERMRAWLKRNAEGVRGTAQTGFSIED
jgi:hypothetical protein